MPRNDVIGIGILLGYYILIAGTLPILIKAYTRLPFEVVRKIHHIAYAASIFLQLKLFSAWVYAIIPAILIVALEYPILLWMERSGHAQFASQREGESGDDVKKQLIYLQ